MIEQATLRQQYAEIWRTDPQWIACAPGRINLIGEHTDYNGGFAMPAAIDRNLCIAAGPSGSDEFELHSITFQEKWTTRADRLTDSPGMGTWQSYFLAVIDQFQKKGCHIPGLRAVIDGDIPHGAGLSSSAAFTVCTAVLVNGIRKLSMKDRELALLSQAAENGPLVGVSCGVMDQYTSIFGQHGHVLKLDCHNLEHELVSFDSSLANILVIDSGKKRGLADSEYNSRRKQCEEGLHILREKAGESFPTLRHVPAEVVDQYAENLPGDILRRVRHNHRENRRVFDFQQALSRSNMDRAGSLLLESHESLRNDFEVSCTELDTLVEIAASTPGVYGCRMTGAGFGGSAIALVDPEHTRSAEAHIGGEYRRKTGLSAGLHVATPSGGAGFNNIL